jgi:hypothetical protein
MWNSAIKFHVDNIVLAGTRHGLGESLGGTSRHGHFVAAAAAIVGSNIESPRGSQAAFHDGRG